MKPSILETFTPDSQTPIQHQISDFIRNLYQNGGLLPNDKLPPIRDLATLWNTNYFTVNLALKQLVQEGLIIRKPRLGSFMKGTCAQLSNVGIYMRADNVANDDDLFYMSLIGCIQSCLRIHNAKSMLFPDDRKDRHTALPELQKAIQMGHVNYLIGIKIDDSVGKWMEKLPIPCTSFSSWERLHPVYASFEDITRGVLQRFLEIGCRSVGLVNNAPLCAREEGVLANLPQCFFAQARKLGLECRQEWVVGPEIEQGADLSRIGFESFHAFWRNDRRPEGVFIFPDILATGCIHAISQLKIDIPRELKVIVHRNKGLNIHVPFPCDWIESSAMEVAKALVAQLEEFLAGRKPGMRALTWPLVTTTMNEQGGSLA